MPWVPGGAWHYSDNLGPSVGAWRAAGRSAAGRGGCTGRGVRGGGAGGGKKRKKRKINNFRI